MTLGVRKERIAPLYLRRVEWEEQPKTPKEQPVPSITTADNNNGSNASVLSRKSDLKLREQQMRFNLVGDDNANLVPGDGSFAATVAKRFKDWDKDGNKFLSVEEIDRAMLDSSYKGNDAAALATLKARVSELQSLSDDEIGPENDGLSENDLAAYEAAKTAGNKDVSTENTYGGFQYKIKESSTELFPDGTPSLDALKQGRIGNCYFIAALGSKVSLDPDSVKKMIKDNGDGTYQVTLPGKEAVTVTKPTDAEIAYFGGAGKNGLWASVLEKAAGQLTGKSNVISSNTILPQDEMDRFSLGSTGISTLTDKSTDADMLTATRYSTTRNKLDAAFKNKKMVTAGIGGFTGNDSKDAVLPSKHAYSIIGWDRSTDTVTLRNPWGRRELQDAKGKALDGKDDGTFTMKLADFYKQFTSITYEQ
jgi:hypothetical protein